MAIDSSTAARNAVVNVTTDDSCKIILHEFTMMDCEDPQIYIAQPIYEWQKTEIGKWCMENATDLEYHYNLEHTTMGYRVVITGALGGKNLSYFLLKKG